MRSAPFASFDLVHTGTCSVGCFAGGGILERSNACRAARGRHARTAAAMETANARFKDVLNVVMTPSLNLLALCGLGCLIGVTHRHNAQYNTAWCQIFVR